MGDPSTDMRDPVFYTWHAFVDDLFQKYKGTLAGYTIQQVNIILYNSLYYIDTVMFL